MRALRQQVSQIQDEVARQALISRSREIEASLSRGNVEVVVFGTGSAGKTSLINALVGPDGGTSRRTNGHYGSREKPIS